MKIHVAVFDQVFEDLHGIEDSAAALMPEDLLKDYDCVSCSLWVGIDVINYVEDRLHTHQLLADQATQDGSKWSLDVVGEGSDRIVGIGSLHSVQFNYKIPSRLVQKMTDGELHSIISQCFQNNANYEFLFPKIQDAVSADDMSAIQNVVRHIQATLYAPNLKPTTKILALRLTKSLAWTGSYWYMLLIEVLVLPWVVQVVRFKNGLPLDQRAVLMFGELARLQGNAEPIQAGKSLLRMTLEILKVLASWIPIAPYQLQQFPTLFKANYDKMIAERIQFPDSLVYCKQGQKQQYFQSMTKREPRKAQIVRRVVQYIQTRVKEAIQDNNSDQKALLQALLLTGDNHIISAEVDACLEVLASQQSLFIESALTFTDRIFLSGDPQAVFEVRAKMVPLLIEACLTKPHLKQRVLVSLATYSHFSKELIDNGRPTNRKIYEVLWPLIGDTGNLESLYRATAHSNEVCQAKWPKWAGITSEEQAFVKGLEENRSVEKNITFRREDEFEDRVNCTPLPESNGRLEGIGILTESINPQKAQKHWALPESPQEITHNFALGSHDDLQLPRIEQNRPQPSQTGRNVQQLRESQIRKLVNSHSRLSRSAYSSKISEKNSRDNSKHGSMISLKQNSIESYPEQQQPSKLYVEFHEYSPANQQDQEELDIVEVLRNTSKKVDRYEQFSMDSIPEIRQLQNSKMVFNDSLFVPLSSAQLTAHNAKWEGIDSVSTQSDSFNMPEQKWKPQFKFPSGIPNQIQRTQSLRSGYDGPTQIEVLEVSKNNMIYYKERANYTGKHSNISSSRNLQNRLLMPQIPEY